MWMPRSFCVMYVQVSRDLVGESFPERAHLWENLVTSPDKLGMFVDYTTDRYIQLYLSRTGHDKHAELYFKWLDVTREFTCKSKQMKLQQLLRRHLETQV